MDDPSKDSLNSEPLDLSINKLANNNLLRVRSNINRLLEIENAIRELQNSFDPWNVRNESDQTINVFTDENSIIDITIEVNPHDIFTHIPHTYEITLPPKRNRNSLQCTICGKEYKINRTLASHKRNDHGVEDYTTFYPCEICHKTFPNSHEMLCHLSQHRNRDGDLNCPICYLSFKRLSELIFHKITAHPYIGVIGRSWFQTWMDNK